MSNKLVALVILDGWGIGKEYEGNAIHEAKTPNYKMLLENYPSTKLEASGLSVGLPEGQMGNSEVGHLNIGAGRVIYQEFTRISKSIENEEFFTKEELIQAIDNAKNNNSKLHVIGLLSDGGVHSHNSHLYSILQLAKKRDLKDVYIHCFLDGRDVPPKSARKYIEELEEKIDEIGIGKIATISGRYYAMDRDKRWDRTAKAYNAIALGKGREAHSALEVINKSYNEEVVDEFVVPTVILKDTEAIATVDDNDSIIFYNFRPDRARQITRAFVDKDFNAFERDKIENLCFICMTQYDKDIKNVEVAFKPKNYKNTLGEYVSNLGYNQLRIAETEKYAHVTFFFNGGVEKPNEGEDRILIPSPKVATYDIKPEMSAIEVKDKAIEKINENKYELIILNFANSDMVGHTGKLDATIKAVETVDSCINEVTKQILDTGGSLIITADHGNAERMIDEETGDEYTAHTSNDVPCIVVGEGDIKLREGILADIAPTLLDMMNIEIPQEMTGESLIIK